MKQRIIDDFKGIGEMVKIPCSAKYTNCQPLHVCKEIGLVTVKELSSSIEIAKAWSKDIYSDFGGASSIPGNDSKTLSNNLI